MTDYAYTATERTASIFEADWTRTLPALRETFSGANVLVIGGAGTIGAAAVRRLCALRPKSLHVVDIDENGLARLARAIMSDGAPGFPVSYLAADFAGFPMRRYLDDAGPFDVVLDFAAVKHVRSEKNLPALLHLLDVNIVRQHAFFRMLEEAGAPKKLFAVSTDKAADPANFMGASKRLLEEVVKLAGARNPSMVAASARFANVAFSAGSLLESFVIRVEAGKPLAAPENTRRYFISPVEAAEICLIGAAVCPDGLAVVPDAGKEIVPTEMAVVAERFLAARGMNAVFLKDEQAAKRHLAEGRPGYPVLLTPLDTAGEKDEEIFVGLGEEAVGIGLEKLLAVRSRDVPRTELEAFLATLSDFTTGARPVASVGELADLTRGVLPNFDRVVSSLSLDDRV